MSTMMTEPSIVNDLLKATSKLMIVIVVVLFVFRSPELVSLFIASPGHAFMMAIVLLAMWSLTRKNSEKLRNAFNSFKRVGLILLVRACTRTYVFL